jgi:hypothetical protein
MLEVLTHAISASCSCKGQNLYYRHFGGGYVVKAAGAGSSGQCRQGDIVGARSPRLILRAECLGPFGEAKQGRIVGGRGSRPHPATLSRPA